MKNKKVRMLLMIALSISTVAAQVPVGVYAANNNDISVDIVSDGASQSADESSGDTTITTEISPDDKSIDITTGTNSSGGTSVTVNGKTDEGQSGHVDQDAVRNIKGDKKTASQSVVKAADRLGNAKETTGKGSLRLVYDEERYNDEFEGGSFVLKAKQDIKQKKDSDKDASDTNAEYEIVLKKNDSVKLEDPVSIKEGDQILKDIPSDADPADSKPESADIKNPNGGITYSLSINVPVTPVKELINSVPKDSDETEKQTEWLHKVSLWARANNHEDLQKQAETAAKETDEKKIGEARESILKELQTITTAGVYSSGSILDALVESVPKDGDDLSFYQKWLANVQSWADASKETEISKSAKQALDATNSGDFQEAYDAVLDELKAEQGKDNKSAVEKNDSQTDAKADPSEEKLSFDIDLGDVTLFNNKTSLYYIGTDLNGNGLKAETMDDYTGEDNVDVTFKNISAVDSIDFIPAEYFLNDKIYKKAVEFSSDDQGQLTKVTEDPDNVTNIIHVSVDDSDVQNGRFVAKSIPHGKYVIRINKDAENGNSRHYFINDSKEVEINGDNNAFNSQARQQTATVKAQGKVLTGIKNGVFQWETKPVEGVVYEVRAAEDITDSSYTEHNETDSVGDPVTNKRGDQDITHEANSGVVYHKDDLIETITTDADGVAKTTKNLYNGKYYVVEKSVPGYLKTKGEIQEELDSHTAEESNARKDQSNDIGDETKGKNSKSSDEKLSPASFKEDKDYFIRSYQVGTDIPAGTYEVKIGNPKQAGYYYVYNGSTNYHDIQKMHDAPQETDAMLDYESSYVTVKDGQTLVLKNGKIASMESHTKENSRGEDEPIATDDRSAFTVDPDHYMEFVTDDAASQDHVTINFDYDSESANATLKKTDEMPDLKINLKANHDIYDVNGNVIVKAGDVIHTYDISDDKGTVAAGLPDIDYAKIKDASATDPLYTLEYAEKPYGITVKEGTKIQFAADKNREFIFGTDGEVTKDKERVIQVEAKGNRLTSIKDGKFVFEEKPLPGVEYEIVLDKDTTYIDENGEQHTLKSGVIGTIVTDENGIATTDSVETDDSDDKENESEKESAESSKEDAEAEKDPQEATESVPVNETGKVLLANVNTALINNVLLVKANTAPSKTRPATSTDTEKENASDSQSKNRSAEAGKSKTRAAIPLHYLTDYSVREVTPSVANAGAQPSKMTSQTATFDKSTGVAKVSFANHAEAKISITVNTEGAADGTVIGLYAKNDIYNSDGTVIAKAGTKISTQTTSNGSTKFTDLATNAYTKDHATMYYVKVESVKSGAKVDGKTYDVVGDKDAIVTVSAPAEIKKAANPGDKTITINSNKPASGGSSSVGSGSNRDAGSISRSAKGLSSTKTGDNARIGIFAGTAAVAAALLAILGIKKKKTKKIPHDSEN